MHHTDLRTGRVVQPVERAAMSSICPTYRHGVSGGVIVDLDPDQPNTVGVTWIDHYGPQQDIHTLHPAQLIPTRTRARRTWLRWRDRAATSR
jgi:hypothetical protein